jgi:hypothetical protein
MSGIGDLISPNRSELLTVVSLEFPIVSLSHPMFTLYLLARCIFNCIGDFYD